MQAQQLRCVQSNVCAILLIAEPESRREMEMDSKVILKFLIIQSKKLEWTPNMY